MFNKKIHIKENLNDVVLIGGNHHNGLGLVRSFGINGIKAYGIIVGEDAEMSFCRKSKYWKQTWAVKTEEEALVLLKKEFSNKKLKPVVIPYSDGVAKIIDNHLEELSIDFILPSLNNEEGAIAKLMDKQRQVAFAKTHGLKMLESYILDISKNKIYDLKIPLPVILKPVASVEGKKSDISICKTDKDYQSSVDIFRKNGYKRLLVQKYLENKDEYVLTGSIAKELITFDLVKSIRRWPVGNGTGSFSEFVVRNEPIEFGKLVLNKLSEIGYRGPIDIEFFEDKNHFFYLNEINWRSSGRNFVSLYTGNYSGYQYYCKCINYPMDNTKVFRKSGYNMNECTDIRHLFKGYPLLAWLRDVRKSQSFAYWYNEDLRPAFAQYKHYLFKILHLEK
jgi:predicted ATP-grasp superfamily ATP-dependent carboligase